LELSSVLAEPELQESARMATAIMLIAIFFITVYYLPVIQTRLNAIRIHLKPQ
jgi:hypothetical protein